MKVPRPEEGKGPEQKPRQSCPTNHGSPVPRQLAPPTARSLPLRRPPQFCIRPEDGSATPAGGGERVARARPVSLPTTPPVPPLWGGVRGGQAGGSQASGRKGRPGHLGQQP